MDKILEYLRTVTYISNLDLTDGYWQSPFSFASQEKTVFLTPFGRFHFRTMPFDLHEAAATFQKLMDRALRGHQQYAAVYLDDIVMYSDN